MFKEREVSYHFLVLMAVFIAFSLKNFINFIVYISRVARMKMIFSLGKLFLLFFVISCKRSILTVLILFTSSISFIDFTFEVRCGGDSFASSSEVNGVLISSSESLPRRRPVTRVVSKRLVLAKKNGISVKK